MGSGTSNPSTTSGGGNTSYSNRPVATTKPMANDPDDSGRTVVRENKVAPIIIKNCKEEFQHVTDFKEPLVYGKMEENMPEHALVRNKYFMVKDSFGIDDRLRTLGVHNIPNLRKHKGDFPVWSMGQPSRDGLGTFMQGLKEDGYKDIILVNLRAEPVVFVADGYDLVAYGPRHPDHINELIVEDIKDTTELEVQIRKETIDLASFVSDQTFYFYTSPDVDPKQLRMAYEDDMALTDEIYSRLSFNNSGIRFLRVGLTKDSAPKEHEIDAFIDMFRHIPGYFDGKKSAVPALVFSSHQGLRRGTLGMVMGVLMIAHKAGFPATASKSPFPINEKSPNFERGEFHAIQRLTQYLPNGLKIKHEVDCIIDQCCDMYNIRSAALEVKTQLENITEDYIIEGVSAKEYLMDQCIKKVEVYFLLICLNAYLHDQYRGLFGASFQQWMERQPEIYKLLSNINVSEHTVPPSLLTSGVRKLVADDHLGLDVLSSQMDVKTSNFRRVPGLPIYGMAQPSREGLSGVVNFLLNSKQGHPLVVLFNLREDLVVECNGATYSVREPDNLEEPILLYDITTKAIEQREEALKKEIKIKKHFEVYMEVTETPESKEFNSVLTVVDMVDQLKMQNKQLQYYRLPMSDDCAPQEKVFDELMSVICSRQEVCTDEDGPALVFQCRTGKGRTTTATAIAGLIICHKRGFPYGTKPGEEERVSLPNAMYTQGNYKIVHDLVRRIPNGQQVKREVDFILNQCSETMTPMHYHAREVIFVTYNKKSMDRMQTKYRPTCLLHTLMKKAKTDEDRIFYKKRALDYLERYMYLILFNTYLHCERRHKWKMSFSIWMKEVASKVGVYELLDTLAFYDFETTIEQEDWLKGRRKRWSLHTSKLPIRGKFV